MPLFFYNIPKKLLSKQDAISIAEKILAIESENKIALDTIKKIGQS